VAGELRTPTLASGCLAGVTRGLVLEWYDVTEIDEPLGVVAVADEIFLTSTTRDVQPVSQWDQRMLAAPGPVTRAVQEAWRRNEAADLDP
jgi:branched-chain amino acid aminotransferase